MTEEQELSHIGALFICKCCGKLGIIPDFLKKENQSENLTISTSPSKLRIKLIQKSVSIDTSINLQDLDQYQNFLQLVQETDCEETHSLPLCPHCLHRKLVQINSMIHQIKLQTQVLREFTKEEFDSLKETAQKQIQIYKTNTIAMKKYIDLPNKQMISLPITKSDLELDKNVLKPYEDINIDSKYSLFNHLFDIDLKEQMGHINGLRLSIFHQEFIPLSELNSALMVICFLIQNFSRILNRNQVNIQFGATAYVELPLKPNSPPEIIPFSLQGYDNKSIRLFNVAIHVLMVMTYGPVSYTHLTLPTTERV